MKPDQSQGRSNGATEPESRDAREARIRSLLERSRTGDQSAFRELVVLHQDQAYGLALRITRSPADAEEVAQDAFVRAWLALARFRGESSFGTWLHRIVARRAFDRLAQLRTRRGREVGVEEVADLPGPVARAAGGDPESSARARRIERMVGALPATQRAAVTLYYYEDRSVEQVARILGMPENTVKTHLSRARAALRTAWQREEA